MSTEPFNVTVANRMVDHYETYGEAVCIAVNNEKTWEKPTMPIIEYQGNDPVIKQIIRLKRQGKLK